jgi:hypothetical protein
MRAASPEVGGCITVEGCELPCRLHAAGQHWVPITDCGIPHAADDPAFISGLELGVFINDVTGQPYLGQVGGEPCTVQLARGA